MRFYPAVDLFEGQAVRLRQGDYSARSSYGDPLEAALRYEQEGATHLHVVDLDAARSGQPHPDTRRIVERIATRTRLLLQLGGGIRAMEDLSRWFSLGVDRCVLGTAAAADPGFAGRAIEQYGDRVTVSIDARDGRVATHGWTRTGGLDAEEFAQTLCKLGLKECIYTDIAQDGMLRGPNIEASVRLARASGLCVIVSGGVADAGDIRAVAGREREGLCGVIAGTALYEGRLTLQDALRAAGQNKGGRPGGHEADHSVF